MITSSETDISLNQNSSIEKVMTEFAGDVKGTPRIAFMVNDAQHGFYRSLTSTNSTINVVYNTKIVIGENKLSGVTLAPNFKKSVAAKIRPVCGDEYVVQINKGGRLSINLVFDFGSTTRRKKWQSLLTLNGAWSTISSDLKNKMETTGLDGTMTIKVNQVGGMPNQALAGVKTCALNSADDFAKCQAQMDALMDYAANTFPGQVQSNPATLSYQTSSLRLLGISGFTDLDPKVLNIRKELALLSANFSYYEQMNQLAAEKHLSVDPVMQSNLTFNQQTVKDAADLCYDYIMMNGVPDFNRCSAAFADLNQELKPLIAERITVYDTAVPANSFVGYALFNRYGTRMRIAYAIDPTETWNFGTGLNPRFDGIDPKNNTKGSTSLDTLKPSESKGRMLLRTAQGYEAAPQNGEADIYPGEALGFVMNDESHLYTDNRGSISVYWRCVDCQAGIPEQLTERIRVPATEQGGVIFQSHAASGGSYAVNAYGRWRNAPNATWSDARGLSRPAGSGALLPGVPYQALLMTRDFATYEAVGPSKKFSLAPGQTVYFVNNEDKGGFKDNEGELELILQCSDCQW